MTQSGTNSRENILITLHIRTTYAAIHYKCSYALFAATFKRYTYVHKVGAWYTPHLWCTVARGPSVPHFELLPALGSVTGHIKVDHTIKVCHFHLPPIRTGAVVNGLMRALHRPLQEDVGGCYTEKADNVVDICLLYVHIWRVAVSTCLRSLSNYSATVQCHTLMNM